jgi:YHS domain-containing protein
MRMTLRKLSLSGLASTGLLMVVLLSGCSSMTAQNPSGNLRPVNAVAEANDRVMLKGADVVAYFTQSKYVQGNPQYSSRYQDVSFRFASAEHKALFDAAPQKYLPQFGGYCANGIVYAIPWGGDADAWRIVDGKLYIFGGQASKDGFELDLPGNIKLADQYWKNEVEGSNSFWQRSKRLVFRVPHYKSGEELAKDVATARAKKAQGG